MADAGALADVARHAGLVFDTVRPTAQGESHSTYEVTAGVARLLLKLAPAARRPFHDRAARACHWLAAHGYPVPPAVTAGVAGDHAYTLRGWLPGEAMAPEDDRHAARLIDLIELQAGGAAAAALPAEDWPGSVTGPVLEGGAGYCLLETMRTHSAETSALLDQLQAIVIAGHDALPPPDDIVHYDFNPANILVDAGAVSGVVDWEGVRAGDRAFDLATLLFYQWDAPAARAALQARLAELRPPQVTAVYLAHIILRQTEWSLRLHPPELARRYLDRAHRVLAAMAP
jgi:aminoglycoside phosphotransferase (APT) family kinase protein